MRNYSGSGALPDSTTNTARPGALDSTNVTAGQAAAQSKCKDAIFSDVKGLSQDRNPVGARLQRRSRANRFH